ncbi:hypothetical protein ACHAWX_003938 [Stephanocyclus meneghinianus]
MSRYLWHPLHPPPLPTHAIASKIALIGPIGKCLEAALYELCDEDGPHDAEDGCSCDKCPDDCDCIFAETDSTSKLDQYTGPIHRDCDNHASKNDMNGANVPPKRAFKSNPSKHDSNRPESKARRSTYESSPRRNEMDQSIALSILESYSHSVANTIFDNRKKSQSQSSTKDQLFTSTKIAPAALLKGEIDHYNRIGGQWRLVVKNAVLTSRNVAQVDNGRDGRGQRTRMMLDWDGNGAPATNYDINTEAVNDSTTRATRKRTLTDRVDSYRFKGTVQILAFNDDT